LSIELFDENIKYGYDCELYYKMINKYGVPKICHSVTVVNYLWGGSITSQTSQDMINKEIKYILNKYGVK